MTRPIWAFQYVMARYPAIPIAIPRPRWTRPEGLSLDVSAALKDPLRRDLRDRFVITIEPGRRARL